MLFIYKGTDENDKIEDYRIEDGKILSNYTPLYIKYLYRVVDTTKFSTTFATALAARIAAELAYAITNSQTLGKSMLEVYTKKLDVAKGMDAQASGAEDVVGQDQWIEGRY